MDDFQQLHNQLYRFRGTHTVTVTVSDGTLTDTQDVTVTVADVEVTPVLQSITDITVNESDTVSFSPTATDPDGDTLTFSYSDWMTSNSYTTNYTDSGTHTVTVTVSDGTLTDSQDVTITVTDVTPLQTIIPTWTDTVGVTVNGNSITKNASIGWGNSGAASQESFTGNGGVEFLATQTNTYRLCGLSSTNPDANYASIEYGILPYENGPFHVFENGADKGDFGSYQIGDRFKVERIGSTIVYKKNDVIFYTSGTPTDLSLFVDCAIYNNGGEISDVTLTAAGINAAPVLNTIADITVNEGGTVTFSPTATDPDGDTLTFSYSGWMSSNSYVTISGDAGTHTVTVTVSDGIRTDSQDVTVTVKDVNLTPVLQNIVDITVNEGGTVTFSPTATDPDGDTLTFSYSGWMTSSSYTTDYTDSGVHTVTVMVSDGTLTDSQDVTVTVTGVNVAPVLDTIADIMVNEGDTVSFSPTATDPGGDTLTFSYSGWMTAGSYTTDYTDSGVHTVTVTVSDGTLTDTQDVTVMVTGVNLAPVLQSITDITVNEGDTVSFSPTATDPDGDTLTFSYSGWMTSGSYTTDYTDSGVHTVTVTVSDGTLTDTQDVTVMVTGVNLAPVLQSITDITVNESDTVSFSPTATDPDGDTLTFSYSDWMTSNSYTTNYTDSGTHTVTVTVSDGTLTDSQDVTITVTDVTPLQTIIPTWTDTVGVTVNGNSITKNASIGWGNSGAASQESFTGNGGVEFLATQTNTYRLCGLSSTNPDANYASIEYGILPYENGPFHVFENGADKGDFGSYQIGDRFKVERIGSTIVYKKNDVIFYTSGTPTDLSLFVDCAIYNNGGEISDVTLTAAGINAAPVLNTIADITVNEGGTVTFSPTATDPDGDTLTFSYSGWMSSNSYVTISGDAGTHTVTVTVSDGIRTDSQDVTVTVKDVNLTPVLQNIVDITVNEGGTVTFSPTATDPDGDTLTFSYSGWMTSSSYTTDYTDSGVHTVTVMVSDGTLTDSQDVTVTVTGVNVAPVLDTIADIMVNEGDTVSFSPTATDPGGDTLTFSYSGWMTAGSYTTDYTDSGVHTVTVTVSDGTLTDTQDVTVMVTGVNLAPVLQSITDITVNEGDTVSFSPTATDPDGDTLTFSYSGWMTSGSYTTDYTDSGVHTVTVTVSDGTLTDTQDVTVMVTGVNLAPVLQSITDITVNESDTVSFSPTATDPDGDTLTFSYSDWMTSNSYTTNYTDSGTHTVTVTVSDGTLTDSQDVTITVTDVTPLQTIIPTWTDTVGVTVNGNSITKNASIGWGNSGAASQESFTGNGGVEFLATQTNTYRLCGLSSTNPDANYASIEYGILPYENGPFHVFENGADKGDFGSYQIGDRFKVERIGSTIVYKKNDVIFYTSGTPTDLSLFVDCAIYNNGGEISDVTLTAAGINAAPVLNTIADITVNEGGTVTFSPTATDPDGDTLTFSYSGWMSSNSYVTISGDAGTHTVTVTVSDGIRTDSQDVTVTVKDVNLTPVLQNIVDITVNEGGTVTFSPTATDPDGDTLTFSYSGWMTSSSYTTDYTDSGVHTVTVMVSDGTLTDSQDVTVTVTGVNVAPVLDTIADIMVNEGDTVSFSPTATDPGGDTLTFSYSGWMTAGSYTTDYTDSGVHTVTVTVSDGTLTDTQDVTVMVTGVNLAPVLQSITDITVNEGDTVSFSPTATDPDGDTLTFSYSGWMTSGSYTTDYTDSGVHTVTVTVSDGTLTDTQDVTVMVTGVNLAPVLQSITDITVNESDTVSFSPTATDPDGDTLTFSYSDWMTSNSYTTNYTDSGTHTVTVTVSDGTLTDSQDVTITVTDVTPLQTIIPTWTDTVGVTVNGNSITKNASIGWGNSGAASQESFTGNGGVEFLATQTNTYRFMRLIINKS